MGLFEKAMRFAAAGGAEAEGLAILREATAELRKGGGRTARGSEARAAECRLLRVLLDRLAWRKLVTPEALQEGRSVVSEYEASE